MTVPYQSGYYDPGTGSSYGGYATSYGPIQYNPAYQQQAVVPVNTGAPTFWQRLQQAVVPVNTGAPTWWQRQIQAMQQQELRERQMAQSSRAMGSTVAAQPTPAKANNPYGATYPNGYYPYQPPAPGVNPRAGGGYVLTPAQRQAMYGNIDVGGNTQAQQPSPWNPIPTAYGPPAPASAAVPNGQGTPYWMQAMYGQGYQYVPKPESLEASDYSGYGGGYGGYGGGYGGGGGGYGGGGGGYKSTAPVANVDRWLYGLVNWRVSGL
jgi:uncharacterized membrane protein YgcG